MPWSIVKKGKEFCVQKDLPDGGSENVTCHPTRAAALKHQRALYVNAPEGKSAKAAAWEAQMEVVVAAAKG